MAVALKKHSYAGDVSALCLLPYKLFHIRHKLSLSSEENLDPYSTESLTSPTLLAGIGGQLFWYDLSSGRLLLAESIFDGVRIHGIHVQEYCQSLSKGSSSVAEKAEGISCKEEKGGGQVFREGHSADQGLVHMGSSFKPIPTKVPSSVDTDLTSAPSKGPGPRNSSSRIVEPHAPEEVVVVVHGERRVKILSLMCRPGATQAGEGLPHEKIEGQFRLLQELPRFNHWVMDVRLLNGSSGAGNLLAIGFSDNSVKVADWSLPAVLLHATCSERSLLYSLRLTGHSLADLQVAAGTIYNEVLIWPVPSLEALPENQIPEATEVPSGRVPLSTPGSHRARQRTRLTQVAPWHCLRGHEGSIHRLTWAADGRRLISVSDDRSARVWEIGASADMPAVAGPVLFGHSARLWDAVIDDQVIITVSEDCTLRLWASDGHPLATLQAHRGRGIWRCLYVPEAAVAVTAGADSAIKIHRIGQWLLTKGPGDYPRLGSSNWYDNGRGNGMEGFIITPANFLLPGGKRKDQDQVAATAKKGLLTDSKSEYVRCFQLAGPHMLYVATNQGLMYRCHLVCSPKPEPWMLVASPAAGQQVAPIVCLSVLHGSQLTDSVPAGTPGKPSLEYSPEELEQRRGLRLGQHSTSPDHQGRPFLPLDTLLLGGRYQKQEQMHTVVYGDGLGWAAALHFAPDKGAGNEHWQQWRQVSGCRWKAGEERRLLGVFCCASLGSRHVFTSDPAGCLLWWHLEDSNTAITGNKMGNERPAAATATMDRAADVSNTPPCQPEGALWGLQAIQVARCWSPVGSRIVCVDACRSRQRLVCGDQRGNLFVFAFPAGLPLARWMGDACAMWHIPSSSTPARGPCLSAAGMAEGLDSPPRECQVAPDCQLSAMLKGAHGISSMAAVAVSPGLVGAGLDILSTGRDGCICTYRYLPLGATGRGRELLNPLVCVGIERTPNISIVEALEVRSISGGGVFEGWEEDGASGFGTERVAVGFAATDFVIWNLTNQSEILRVTCGGWKRPHSHLVGDDAAACHCFVYLKDDQIFVTRRWPSDPQPLPLGRHQDSNKLSADSLPSSCSPEDGARPSIVPRSLHLNHHGREMHAALFIPPPPAGNGQAQKPINLLGSSSGAAQGSRSQEHWIVTGAEDGAICLTRYNRGEKQELNVCKPLGQHVGGSAVRALAMATPLKYPQLPSPLAHPPPPPATAAAVAMGMEAPEANPGGGHRPRNISRLLFSAGAKEILMCWLLTWVRTAQPGPAGVPQAELYPEGHGRQGGQSEPSDEEKSNWLLHTQWLSTFSPRRIARGVKPAFPVGKEELAPSSEKDGQLQAEAPGHGLLPTPAKEKANFSTGGGANSKSPGAHLAPAGEDDQRILALTAFTLGDWDASNLVAFVATASSDAQVTLHAFQSSRATWHTLAKLEYHKSPVLTLEHVVRPLPPKQPAQQGLVDPVEEEAASNVYLLFSGSTDGSIAIWDMTPVVMQFAAQRHTIYAIRAPNRPITGRGSQGGGQQKAAKWNARGAQQAGSTQPVANRKSTSASTKVASSPEIPQGGQDQVINVEQGMEPGLTSEATHATANRAATGMQVPEQKSRGGEQVATLDGFVELSGDSTPGGRPALLQIETEAILKARARPRGDLADSQLARLLPVHVLSGVHQSGVNCLSVATMDILHSSNGKKDPSCIVEGSESTENSSTPQDAEAYHQNNSRYDKAQTAGEGSIADGCIQPEGPSLWGEGSPSSGCRNGFDSLEPSNHYLAVVSGGDDQAVHVSVLSIAMWPNPAPPVEEGVEFSPGSGNSLQEPSLGVKCIHRQVIPMAHSSAVKGIWTDGNAMFSTGLDQRLRCWHLAVFPAPMASFNDTSAAVANSNAAPVKESLLQQVAWCVIDVPEAAELHVAASPHARCVYEVVVVGRGMQIIECEKAIVGLAES